MENLEEYKNILLLLSSGILGIYFIQQNRRRTESITWIINYFWNGKLTDNISNKINDKKTECLIKKVKFSSLVLSVHRLNIIKLHFVYHEWKTQPKLSNFVIRNLF